uniref:Uncharacterized protein n=1 Tax=Arundo donax TaxID=35708 RepID=A0A0A9HA81_ARUDO
MLVDAIGFLGTQLRCACGLFRNKFGGSAEPSMPHAVGPRRSEQGLGKGLAVWGKRHVSRRKGINHG